MARDVAALARPSIRRFRSNSPCFIFADLPVAQPFEADLTPPDVAPTTKATAALGCMMLNCHRVPDADGVTRVHVPAAPSWTARHSGVWLAVQNSYTVLPLPPVAAVTVNVSVAVCSANVPEFPRTVTVAWPTVAVPDAVSVS